MKATLQPRQALLIGDARTEAIFASAMAETDPESGKAWQFHRVSALADALPWLAGHGADVVLTELKLPDASGWDALVKLKSSFPQLPVLIVSDSLDEEEALSGVQIGAEDYLRKDGDQAGDWRRAIGFAMIRNAQYRDVIITNRKLTEKVEKVHRALSLLVQEIRTPLDHTRHLLARLIGGQFGLIPEEQLTLLRKASESCETLEKNLEKSVPDSQGVTTFISRVDASQPPPPPTGQPPPSHTVAPGSWSPSAGDQDQTPRRASEPPAKIKVLVIDDEPDYGKFLKYLLDQAGFDTVVTTSGSHGLGILARTEIDVVILDLMMPGMDGAKTLREIRLQRQTVPVVLHTGFPDSVLMQRAMEYSPFTMLAKPCEPEALIKIVRRLHHQERSR